MPGAAAGDMAGETATAKRNSWTRSVLPRMAALSDRSATRPPLEQPTTAPANSSQKPYSTHVSHGFLRLGSSAAQRIQREWLYRKCGQCRPAGGPAINESESRRVAAGSLRAGESAPEAAPRATTAGGACAEPD